jgi:hypothetical protein
VHKVAKKYQRSPRLMDLVGEQNTGKLADTIRLLVLQVGGAGWAVGGRGAGLGEGEGRREGGRQGGREGVWGKGVGGIKDSREEVEVWEGGEYWHFRAGQ